MQLFICKEWMKGSGAGDPRHVHVLWAYRKGCALPRQNNMRNVTLALNAPKEESSPVACT